MLSANQLITRLSQSTKQADRLTILPTPDLSEMKERAATSIDLRLGRWFRSFKQASHRWSTLVKFPDEEALAVDSRQHWVRFGKPFTLHPGRFVLGATMEWLQLPPTLSAYITGKSSLGRNGLIIETASGVHPNFSGCLTLELANVGEIPLEIFPGMKICQVFFHEVESSGKVNLGELSGSRKPSAPAPKQDSVFDALSYEPPQKKPARKRKAKASRERA